MASTGITITANGGIKSYRCALCGTADAWRCDDCVKSNNAAPCTGQCAVRFSLAHRLSCPVQIPSQGGCKRGGGPAGEWSRCFSSLTGVPDVVETMYGGYSSSDEDDSLSFKEDCDDLADVSVVASAQAAEASSVTTPFADLRRLIDVLNKLVLDKTALGKDIKNLVHQTFKETGEGFTQVGELLETLLQEVERGVDPRTGAPISYHVETELKRVSEQILSLTQATKQLAAKQTKIKQTRDAIETTTKKIRKTEASNADKAKEAQQSEKLFESAKAKQETNRQLEKDLAAAKQKFAAYDQHVATERHRVTRELVALRNQQEDIKANRKYVDTARPELDKAKQEADALQQEVDALEIKVKRMQKEHDQMQAAEKALSAPSAAASAPTKPAPKSAPAPAAPKPAPAPLAVAASSSSSADMCFLCRSTQNIGALLNCTHTLCNKCVLDAYRQSQKHMIEFKYHTCPDCHEEVRGYDSMNVILSIEKDEKTNKHVVRFLLGEPAPATAAVAAPMLSVPSPTSAPLTRVSPTWKTELCRLFEHKMCTVKREDCPFAHGESDLRKL